MQGVGCTSIGTKGIRACAGRMPHCATFVLIGMVLQVVSGVAERDYGEGRSGR